MCVDDLEVHTYDALMSLINPTHNPTLRSWVTSGNRAYTEFPIQNLPFGVFRRRHTPEAFRGGVAIGDQILDLAALARAALLQGLAQTAAEAASARADYLAQASERLARSLDIDQTRWALLQLAVG